MAVSTIQGIEALIKKLESLGVNTTPILAVAARDAMRDRVETRIKVKCPVDTGNLRASYNTQIMKETDTEIVVTTGSNKKYAPYMEYGTGIYAEDGSGRQTPWAYYYEGHKGDGPGLRWTRGAHPQPHVRPAWEEGKEKLLGDIANRLRKEMKKALP
jgi:HK97 gp10 family phage protein